VSGDESRGGAGAGADCLIVGGGLSGLACAQLLASAGKTVQVLEADAAVGGRVRTTLYQGEPVDRGFQALFRAYPETRALCDEVGIGRGDLHAFERGLVVHDGTAWRRLRPARTGLLGSTAISRGDAARLASIAVRAAAIPDRQLLESNRQDESALAYLTRHGVSAGAIEGVVRPLFGGIMLDRSLSVDSGYLRYVLAMMTRGPAVLPVDGLGMIAQRAEEAITRAGGMIWTDVRVAAVDRAPDGRSVTGVTLTDGRPVSARHVVLAVDAGNARRLLRELDPATAGRLPTAFAGVVSAAFALEHPLYRERTVLLDAAAPAGDDRVDLICQTTNVTRPSSPGPHILIAQSATHGWTDVDPARYADAVGRRIQTLIPGFPWERSATLVDTFVHSEALYRPLAGVRRNLPGPRTAIANLFVAGDAVMHPSIEGAVSSGRRAARIVQGMLG
jgi:phytoene dehydrogenase-like protein